MRKSNKPDLDDQVLGLVHDTEQGHVDDLTFIQTAESIFDNYPKATSPWTFTRGLCRNRRRHLRLVLAELKKVGRLSRDIHMMHACFYTIGADNNDRKEKR